MKIENLKQKEKQFEQCAFSCLILFKKNPTKNPTLLS